MILKIPLNTTHLKPIAQVASSQMLLQGFGFLISILLIRVLPKEEYALYTIYISIQGILALMSDSGLNIGFKAIGGRIWESDSRISSLIKTASSLRLKVILLALIISIAYSCFILIKQDFSLLNIILFALTMIGIIIPEVKMSFISQALLLKKEILPVQVATIIAQGLRLVLIGGLLLINKGFINIYVVLGITTLSVWASYNYILFKSKHLNNKDSEISVNYRKILLNYLKLNWHTSAFYAFNGQISIFLIGVLGSTNSLADMGALTRFSMIFVIFNALVSNLLSPAFGRENKKQKLFKIFIQTVFTLLVMSALMLLVVYFFPEPFLWILGPHYQNLGYELFLVFISSLIGLLAGTIFSLNAAKGWIKYTPIWEIPINIGTLIIGLYIFDVSTLKGVLWLSIFITFTKFSLYLANSISGFNKLKQ